MGKKKKTQIQIQIEKKKKQDELITQAFAKANQSKKANQSNRKKRKDVTVLNEYLDPEAWHYAIRSADSFLTKSYSLEKQVRQYLGHLFVRYSTCDQLYVLALNDKGRKLLYPDFSKSDILGCEAKWFYAAVQGRSVADLMKGMLTRKEVHCFLNLAPAHLTVRESVYWAKMAAAGVPGEYATIVSRALIEGRVRWPYPRLYEELVQVMAQVHDQLDKYDVGDLAHLVWEMRNEPDFSLAGRSTSSVKKLIDEVGRGVSFIKDHQLVEWKRLYGLWMVKFGKQKVLVRELVSNRDLASEGRWQHHCVFGYVESCRRGSSRIVSFKFLEPDKTAGRDIERSRLTIEVDPHGERIVQIRGLMNRQATKHEMDVIRMWADEHNLSLAYFA